MKNRDYDGRINNVSLEIQAYIIFCFPFSNKKEYTRLERMFLIITYSKEIEQWYTTQKQFLGMNL